MSKIGILAYGSLLVDPGGEIESKIIKTKDSKTPFKVEFARKSSGRDGAPTLIPVEEGGAKVNAKILILKRDITEEEASHMLYRRERDKVWSGKKYKRPIDPDPNDVVIEKINNFHGVKTVFFTSIGNNIEEITAKTLAKLSIESAKSKAGKKKKDGISYLIDAKYNLIKTPIMPEYEKEILRQTDTKNLHEAWITCAYSQFAKKKELDWKRDLIKSFKRLKRTSKNFSDFIVRDPIDYLDFEVNLNKNIDELIFEIKNERYHPKKPYLHTSPKDKGINRPTVVLDIKDALVYRFCIEQIEDELLSKTRQQKNIRGGIKIASIKTPDGDSFYEKWFKDWLEHNESIKKGLDFKPFMSTTDIASYFENINLLILKDLIRSDVKGKKEILNLLFYFLENALFRYEYETNTFTGLIQEDIECSRILAYYFLHRHDERMIEFCKENEGEFYRFVDDMSILVNYQSTAKKALKKLTESLRKLGLVASIEKTRIWSKNDAYKELFINENEILSVLEEELIENLKKGRNISTVVNDIQIKYIEWTKEKFKLKNWIKILKRFYTLLTYAKSNALFSDLLDHILEFPLIYSGKKILKYLMRNQTNENFNIVLLKIINYLYSDENLYPSLETHLLELFLYFDEKNIEKKEKEKLVKFSSDVFFKKNDYDPLSEYARAVACLLIYRFNKKEVKNLAHHYLKYNENDSLLRKYLIFVTLTINNKSLREKIIDKAKKEQDISINRLINLIENIGKFKKGKLIKNYLLRDELYIYIKDKEEFKILEKFNPVRAEILKELIQIYS